MRITTFRMTMLAAAIWLSVGSTASAEGEWVFGGYVGAAHTLSDALSIAQPSIGTDVSFASVDYDGNSWSAPIYYGYRVAYFLPRRPWVGIEAEFIHLKVYARADLVTRVSGTSGGAPLDRDMPIDDIVERFSLSHGLNFALINVVARRVVAARARNGSVALVARAGIGPTIPHAESRIGGVDREGYEVGALGVHVAGGIDLKLLRVLSAMAEYKVTTTNQTVAVSEGHARGRFTSHHAIVGLSWHLD